MLLLFLAYSYFFFLAILKLSLTPTMFFWQCKTVHLSLVIKVQSVGTLLCTQCMFCWKVITFPVQLLKIECQVGCLPRVRSHQIKAQHFQCHSVEYHYNSTGIWCTSVFKCRFWHRYHASVTIPQTLNWSRSKFMAGPVLLSYKFTHLFSKRPLYW